MREKFPWQRDIYEEQRGDYPWNISNIFVMTEVA